MNVLGLDAGDDDAWTTAVLELAAELGGTISAEHGVGVAKAAHLGLVRERRARSRRCGRSSARWTRDGLLNPGAVLGVRD